MVREFIASFRWGELTRELLTVVAIVVVINFVLPRSIVLGHSMEPNLYEGQRLAGSPLPYWFSQPQRGD
ncbi:MAG: S26 family signal peptidase, partial [Anaerolineae bacterium]|nr:S26 family signal peptidase [Anaerolineae bacterium]